MPQEGKDEILKAEYVKLINNNPEGAVYELRCCTVQHLRFKFRTIN